METSGVNLQDNQFDRISKSDIDQRTDRITQTTGHAFGRMAQQPSERHNRHCIHGKDDGWTQLSRLDGDTHRHEDQQNIDPAMEEGGLGVVTETDAAISDPGQGTWFGGLLLIGFMVLGARLVGRAPLWPCHLGILSRRNNRIAMFGDRGIGGRSFRSRTAGKRVSFRPRVNPVYVSSQRKLWIDRTGQDRKERAGQGSGNIRMYYL